MPMAIHLDRVMAVKLREIRSEVEIARLPWKHGSFSLAQDAGSQSALGVERAAKEDAGRGGVFFSWIAVHGQNIARHGGFLGCATGDFDRI